ncbi:hypothetical protein ACVXHA_24850 [Escherichia coli]
MGKRLHSFSVTENARWFKGGVFHRGNVSQTQISKTKKRLQTFGYTLETLSRLTAGGVWLQVAKVVIPEVLIGEVNFGLST